jgi:hypothetical protein
MLSRLALLPALLPVLAAPLAGQGPVDPFVSGSRWTYPATSAAPWIPRDLTFAAGDELLWSAPTAQTPALHLFASGALVDPAAPILADGIPAGAVGPVRVAAGAGAGELYSLHQLPSPTGATRATWLARHDALSAAAGSFTAGWTVQVGPLVGGPGELVVTPDGGVLVAAAFDSAAGQVVVERRDPATGGLLFQTGLLASALRGLATADDGQRIVVGTGLEAVVLDAALAVVHREVLTTSTGAATLSADGRLLTTGDFGLVRVLADDGTTFAEAFTVTGASTELPVQAAISRDGGTLAVSWWDYLTGVDVRLDVVDVPSGAVVQTYAQTGVYGGLQNYPERIDLSDDGQRVALGLWGHGDAQPELVLLVRGQPTPLLAADLPGSVHALDLDAGGTRVAVGFKDAHANLFATTGQVRLYDTGERALQTLGASRPGGALSVAHRRTGALLTYFALGFRAAAPVPLAGVDGALLVDPLGPLVLLGSLPDVTGRADLTVPLTSDPALVGLPLAVQAGSLDASGWELSATALAPALF